MQLAYVVGCYPQPSETFIAREIAGLRRRGHAVEVYSLFAPAGGGAAEVVYGWPTAATRALRRVTGAGALARRWRARFAQADAVVAHFGSLPSTVALDAAGDVPFFLSLHARDLYVEAERLEEKLAHARAVVTCTQANVDHLRATFPAQAEKVYLIYHGLPRAWLDTPLPDRAGDPAAPLRLLAVGRLVEKKGYHVLLAACARLAARGVPCHLRLVGDGPLRASLEASARQLGIDAQVAFAGWLAEDAVRAAYGAAELFCCPSILTPDGDRDGLPNVLVEAMATGLPAVGSALSGIPEAIDEGVTGLLAPPGDVDALADALARCADPRLRARMGKAAAARARARFDAERWLDRLEALLAAR